MASDFWFKQADRSRIHLDLKIPDVNSPFFLKKNQCYEFLLLNEKTKLQKVEAFFY